MRRICSAILLIAFTACRATGQMPEQTANGESQRSNSSRAKMTATNTTNHTLLIPDGPSTSQESPSPTIEQRPLTLENFEQIAVQNNPTLAAAVASMNSARGRRVQAGLFPNPVIGYHATEVGNLGTSGQQGGFVSQRFITAGKLRLDQGIIGKEVDEAHFRFHVQQQRVLSDVRVRFYDALVSQKRIELTRELTRIADELVRATKTLLQAGLATDNQLLQAEIRADESLILFDNARNQHAAAWRRLAAVIGKPRMRAASLSGELVGDLPKLEWDVCYTRLLGANPELSAAHARLDRAGIVISRAKKEPIPNVNLFVSVRHHTITDSDVANVQVGFPIPIFDRNQGNVSAAEAQWIAAKKNVERIELDLQDRLAVAFRKYANARHQVVRYGTRMVPRAKRSMQLVTNGYEKGQVKYLTVLAAQQTYLQVSLSYLDSLRELRVSSAVIDGQLLSESLRDNR